MKVEALKMCFAFGSRRRQGEVFDTREDISQYPFLKAVDETASTSEEGGEQSPPILEDFREVFANQEGDIPLYSCPHCDFVSHKKIALAGHLRKHR